MTSVEACNRPPRYFYQLFVVWPFLTSLIYLNHQCTSICRNVKCACFPLGPLMKDSLDVRKIPHSLAGKLTIALCGMTKIHCFYWFTYSHSVNLNLNILIYICRTDIPPNFKHDNIRSSKWEQGQPSFRSINQGIRVQFPDFLSRPMKSLRFFLRHRWKCLVYIHACVWSATIIACITASAGSSRFHRDRYMCYF